MKYPITRIFYRAITPDTFSDLESVSFKGAKEILEDFGTSEGEYKEVWAERRKRCKIVKVTEIIEEITVVEVGSLVAPKSESNFVLHCGTGTYDKAVVLSVNPFILSSEDSTMKWEATIDINNFKVVGVTDETTLNKCMRRLEY